MKRSDFTIEDEYRFWKKVKLPLGGIGCWEWIGSISSAGYGTFSKMGKTLRSSRLAYLLTYGDFDDKLFVCHTCDNPKCCFPDHLFLGTNHDNQIDSVNKGRNRTMCGEENHLTKLSTKNMYSILSLRGKMATKQIAKTFNVSTRTIEYILCGKRWKHIPRQLELL